MNVQAPIKHTAAEEALFQSYEALRGTFEGSQESRKHREAALAQLRDKGFPTRRVESWHYTDLRAAVKHLSDPTGSRVGKPLVENSIALSADAGIDGLSVTAWNADDAQLVSLAGDDAIGQINTAMATGGTIASIKAGHTIEAPLLVENREAHSRNVINFGAGSSATVIESVTGDDGFSSDVTSISLEEGAKVDYVVTCEKGAEGVQLGQLRVVLEKDAELNIVVFNAGGQLIRREIVVLVEGENSNLDIKGVNLVGGDSHIDVTTVLQHTVPNSVSEQLFRNISTGRGQGVFQGQIKVHQIAQKTDAQMACNTLLLSDDAGFSAKPELEIFADDVVCAHGATVAELDEDHLFYMRARGITERTARALLVEAFVDEAVEQIENEALVEALESRISAWLEANG